MDLVYWIWAFKRSAAISLLYFFICLLGWVLLGSLRPVLSSVIVLVTWAIFFSVYLNDWRTRRVYEQALRQSLDE